MLSMWVRKASLFEWIKPASLCLGEAARILPSWYSFLSSSLSLCLSVHLLHAVPWTETEIFYYLCQPSVSHSCSARVYYSDLQVCKTLEQRQILGNTLKLYLRRPLSFRLSGRHSYSQGQSVWFFGARFAIRKYQWGNATENWGNVWLRDNN